MNVIETVYSLGPATLVEIIDNPEMTGAASIVAEKLKLSGFVEFEFVFDSAGHANLIEMNPQVTPVAYLNGARRRNRQGISRARFEVRALTLRASLELVQGPARQY